MIHPFEKTRRALVRLYTHFKPSVDESLAAQRALEDGAGRAEPPNLRASHEVQYVTTDDGAEILLRIFTPRSLEFSRTEGLGIKKSWRGTILYFHGGGWVSGNTELYADALANLAHATERRIVAVEYRRAPEHRFPVPAEDCYCVARKLFAGEILPDVNPENIVLMGDSAGGNLTAAVSLMARDRGDFSPKTQVLIYPAVNNDYGPNAPFYSVHANGKDFMLTAKDMVDYVELYASSEKDLENPYFAPLLEKDNTRLPRTLIISAELCPLRDEDEYYAHVLSEAGNEVESFRLLSAMHGYLLSPVAVETVQNTYHILSYFLDGEELPSQSRKKPLLHNDYGWLHLNPRTTEPFVKNADDNARENASKTATENTDETHAGKDASSAHSDKNKAGAAKNLTKRTNWYRLDNIGNYYVSELGHPFQTVFRFSAQMSERVDADALQVAFEKTVQEFPNFNVCLRTGFFWHYLQEMDSVPSVTPETDPICARLHFGAKSPLLRVSYFESRINFEVSHMVSDGRGTMAFFQELLRQYVEQRYGENDIASTYEGSDSQKAEDSFSKYYEPVPGRATKLKSAYQINGMKVMEDPTFMELHMPVKNVLELSRSMNVTLTALLIAVVIGSIRQDMKESQVGEIIRIGVPVDLRTAFKSETTKNFFGMLFVSHTTVPASQEPTIAQLAQKVQADLQEGGKQENLKPRMMQMISFEKNRFIQMAPVFIKDKVVSFFSWLTRKDQTTTVSNVGAVKLDHKLERYVKNINVLTGTTGINFVVASCSADLSIGISTVYTNADIIRHIVRYFTQAGIPAYINSSRAELLKDSATEDVTFSKAGDAHA